MAGLQLSGLASGLDWKSLVEQLMQIEATPITRLQTEQSTNTQRSNALRDLGTKLTSLQTAVKGLKDNSVFSSRTTTSSATTGGWSSTASAGTAPGSYQIAVSQLATKARREGSSDITFGLSSTSDVSGVTLATMRTAGTIVPGTFSINGQKITVGATDSLQSVFDSIATASGNDVTASYDATSDRVTLTSASNAEIVLGASNDTSNFLQIMKLSNTGTGAVTSFGTLGSAKTGSPLANSGLKTAITAVDGAGAGSFTINGVQIDYNVNTDSLNTVMKRINASSAGVVASYDAVNDRMTLTNATTGDLGISITEAAGGVLGALGLTTGSTTVRGKNAEFSLDGGPTLVSTSNTLDGTALGVTGLSVTVSSQSTQTITVAADKTAMRAKLDAFVSAYNQVQSYIDEKTKITTSGGKVTTSVLSSNREVQDWASQLRRMAFGSVAGVGGIDQLDDLGLDTDESGQLSIKDADKLDKAFTERGGDVEAFFTSATTGFASKFDAKLTALVKSDTDIQERLSKTNKDIDKQIEDMQRRLDQQRELLTNSFIAMESAQSQIQQQSQALANAFGTSSSSK